MSGPSSTSSRVSPAAARPGLILAVLCVAQFMLVLDISVTNVALVSIQGELGFVTADLAWIVTAYTLPFGSLLIFFGRVGDLFGRRRLFMIGLAVFSIASLACGLAQDPGQLLAARAVQGVGGAMLSPAALSLLTSNFEEGNSRNRALSVWGAIAAGGAAAGMIIGGVLTDTAGWRWVFLINVPIGLAILAVTRSIVSESRGTGKERLDVPGAFLITGAMVALVYGLTEVPGRGLVSPIVLGCLAASVVLLVTFVLVEKRSKAPLVDLSIFRNISVSGANLFSLFSSAVIVGQSFFLSLYFQQVLGWSPLETGLALVPTTVVVVGVAAVIPRVLTRVGVKVVLATAGLLLAAGMLLQARMPIGGSYLADVLPAIVVTGIGLGLGFVGSTIAATNGVPQRQQGLASGLLNTSQQLGGAVGLAALATVAAGRTAASLSDGNAQLLALNDGFSFGYTVAAGFALAAAAVALLLVPGRSKPLPDSQPTAGRAPPHPSDAGTDGVPRARLVLDTDGNRETPPL